MSEPPAEPVVAVGDTPVSEARRRPRFGTIVWGAVLLAFAAFMLLSTAFPEAHNATVWLLGAVIGLGLILVVAGIVAASTRIR